MYMDLYHNISTTLLILYCLVVEPPLLKNDGDRQLDDDIPNMTGNIKKMFQTPARLYNGSIPLHLT